MLTASPLPEEPPPPPVGALFALDDGYSACQYLPHAAAVICELTLTLEEPTPLVPDR